MKLDSFHSPTDCNGSYRTANPVPNPSFRGADVLLGGSFKTILLGQISNISPLVKLNVATQQAIEYYSRLGQCNCKSKV